MSARMKCFVGVLIKCVMLWSIGWGPVVLAESDEATKSLQYPELEVTPLASERLKIEASDERSSRWTLHRYFQISALATILAASQATDEVGAFQKEIQDLDDAQTFGYIVGFGWLAGTALLSAYYSPYEDGWRESQKRRPSTQRDRLTHERLSEESLAGPANWVSKLKWLSVATNLLASLSIASHGDNKTSIFAGISAVLSFTPWIFDHHWEEVYDQHKTYKKKIYGPVFSATLLPTRDRQFVPGMLAQITF